MAGSGDQSALRFVARSQASSHKSFSTEPDYRRSSFKTSPLLLDCFA
jgi:hypothetical protein